MLQMVGKSESCVLHATRRLGEPISRLCSHKSTLGLSYSAINLDYTELCTFQDLISGLETAILNQLKLKRVQFRPINM